MNQTRHPQVDAVAPLGSTGLHVRTGRASSGKSADARSLALDLAATQYVLFVTTEGETYDIVRHIQSLAAGRDDLRLKRILFLETTSLREVQQTLEGLEAQFEDTIPAIVDFANNLSVDDDTPWKLDLEKVAAHLKALSEKRLVVAYVMQPRIDLVDGHCKALAPFSEVADSCIRFERDRACDEGTGTWTIQKAPNLAEETVVPMRLIPQETSKYPYWENA